MRVILSVILGLAMSASCLAKTMEVKGTSLSFEVKDNKVRASANGDSYNFSFTNGKSFSLSAAPEIKQAMMEAMAKKAADEIKDDVKKLKKQPGSNATKIKNLSVNNINLGIFSGQEVRVSTSRKETNSNMEYIQTIYLFFFWDGKMCWKGSFKCYIDSEIGAVHNILKSAKRIK